MTTFLLHEQVLVEDVAESSRKKTIFQRFAGRTKIVTQHNCKLTWSFSYTMQKKRKWSCLFEASYNWKYKLELNFRDYYWCQRHWILKWTAKIFCFGYNSLLFFSLLLRPHWGGGGRGLNISYPINSCDLYHIPVRKIPYLVNYFLKYPSSKYSVSQ